MKITIHQPLSYSHIGRKDNQEDSIYPPQGQATLKHRFFVLCDGMGGHNNGEVASRLVCETLGQFFESHTLKDGFLTEELFKEGLSTAYNTLDNNDDGSFKKMGTTLAFIYLHNGGCLSAHIGDSRIYHIRPGKGLMYQSSDHSLVNELLKIGEITPEEAINHPQKNVITRVMQPHLEQRYKAEIHQLTDIKAGDYFFLCSDGVIEKLTNDQIIAILSDKTISNEQKLKKFEEVGLNKTKDNFTAYLIPINQVKHKRHITITSIIKSLCCCNKERFSKKESTK